ncbi:DUF4082 domain-containing protein [Mycetocola miduiensis]|uniref:DUF4082 domain-containing protein n=1 Tax=Mycetocola miduiensis TaxID=995034 RepID=UPI0015A57F9B|nr:DUF4082 domain-containing protein [Mycetocola miduiensis]
MARSSARKNSTPAPVRFGTVGAATAMLVAAFLAVGPLSASPAQAAESTMLGSSAPTGLVSHSDTAGVEVGTKFSAVKDSTATGMRFFKNGDTLGSHNGTLWSGSGTKLAGASFTGETSTGWQTAQFDRPVALKAGQNYVVSYYAPRGKYAVTYGSTGVSQNANLKLASGSGVYKYGKSSTFPTTSFRNSNYWVDVTLGATTAPAPAPAPSTAPAPAPAPAPSTGFPSADSTGVPAGTALSTYTGPSRITTPNTVINGKIVNSDLQIATTGVKITNSKINGSIFNSGSGSFTISDSQVHVAAEVGTGIGDARFTASRVEVTGGNRSINCSLDCIVENSYLHGQNSDSRGLAHASAVRMGANSIIRGNTIACDANPVGAEAGCSAALTGYGDFAAVKNNTIDGNKFLSESGGFCAYGGSSTGKPYSGQTRDIRFTNNVWERGDSGKCGIWGPIVSFDSNAPGNVWTNNTYEDGASIRAAN